MSIAEHIDERMGVRMYHVQKIVVNKDAEVHGEAAVEVKAIVRHHKEFTATYLKRNKMSPEDIAENFTNKMDSILRGTAEEL